MTVSGSGIRTRGNLRSFLSAAALMICGLGCTSNPQLRSELDTYRAGLRPTSKIFHGKKPFARMPLAEGQWVEYWAVNKEGEPSRMRTEVVGKEGDAYWLQETVTSYKERTEMKVLVANFDNPDPTKIEVRKVLSKNSSGQIAEVPGSRGYFERLRQSLSRLTVKSTSEETMIVAVLAGSFEISMKQGIQVFGGTWFNNYSTDVTEVWVNSEVPLAGVVKMEATDGSYQEELVDFGTSGAKDNFAQ